MEGQKEVVLPFELGVFNVLLTIFSELLLLTLGTLLTKQIYTILIRRRIHNGKPAQLKRRVWLKSIPFGDDLVFDGLLEKLFCAAIRILLVILTFTASIEVGSKQSYEILGTAEGELIANQEPRTHLWHKGQNTTTYIAKHGCEQIDTTYITYRAAVFSERLGRFACRNGSFGEEEDIMILKWNIDEIPRTAQPFNVKHNIFDYDLKTFAPSNATRIWTGKNHYLEFLKDGTRYFMNSTVRDGVFIEIVKPPLEDMFVFTANEINHDRANNNPPGVSIARSLSNHAVWTRNSTKLMTGHEGRVFATLSYRGIIAASVGAFIALIVLPILVLALRRKVSYIRVDPLEAIGIASLCVEDQERRCVESLKSIEFAIMDRVSHQHLGILPKSLSPSKRDEDKPMCSSSPVNKPVEEPS